MTQGTARHILVIDDEPEIRTLLRRCLELEGYAVEEAKDASEARAALARQPISLITLDLKLGAEDGLALAREIRAVRDIPIIMVTGKDDPVDRIVGLELGADDYITKPFHLREVLARVRAVLRRSEAAPRAGETPSPADQPTAGERLEFGGLTLDLARRELSDAQERPVPLTTAEFNMLRMFVERPGRVLSRDTIMELLKGHDWQPFDRSIDTLVARLRKKIEADVDDPRLIKTVRAVGYVFTGEIRRK